MRGALLASMLAGCWSASPPTPTRIEVTVAAPGLSGDDVDAQVAEPVLQELATVEGLRSVLAISDEGRLIVHAEVATGDIIVAQQRVGQSLQGIVLPASVSTPRFHVFEPRRLWLRPGADRAAAHEAAGKLAHRGLAAAPAFDAPPSQVWELDVDALRARGVQPDRVAAAVDASLAGGSWPGGELSLGDEVSLKDVGRMVSTSAAAVALVDGQPAAGLAVVGAAEPDGWLAFTGGQGELCAHALTRPPDALLAGSKWITHAGTWWGRLPGERTDRPSLEQQPGLTVWACDAEVVRIALVAEGEGADLHRARTQLDAWAGATTVLDVPSYSREPKLEVQVRQDLVRALGLDARAVARALGWSGQVRSGTVRGESVGVMLRWPDADDVLDKAFLVTPDRQVVDLMQVADVRIEASRPPAVRVDGRAARLVDVVLEPGSTIGAWTPPSGIDVVPMHGRGPERVWR